MPANQRRQMYYGYAFESWCTASSPSSPPGWGGDVDTNVQWCSVVKTKIGSTRLVIGGEVDCVRGLHRLSLSRFKSRLRSLIRCRQVQRQERHDGRAQDVHEHSRSAGRSAVRKVRLCICLAGRRLR